MIKKIAILRALQLGDMLCMIPAVRAIRSAWPHAEIHLVGLPWQNGFASRFPSYFDHFIPFPGWPGLPEQEPDGDQIVTFLQEIRRYEFDLVVQMHGNGNITNTLCMLWNGKKVCGLRTASGYCPEEKLFPISEDGEHEVLRFLRLVDALNIPRAGTHLEFPITEAEELRFKEIAHDTGIATLPYVCIHPGARDVRRRWAVENFARIADEIAAQGFHIVLTGSAEEDRLLATLQSQIRSPVTNIVERFGHLGAGELAAVISRARLLVSNDTGVSHIAAALAVPSVIIFSPYSDIERWRPLNEELHAAIPHERSADILYVMGRVNEMLTGAEEWKSA